MSGMHSFSTRRYLLMTWESMPYRFQKIDTMTPEAPFEMCHRRMRALNSATRKSPMGSGIAPNQLASQDN
ncbi:hypothetical protein CEXT_712861 [Caerostris extrusa]|uniref:Uncharacterized protein n=1 Tax=Caerostris extrusa TaxID=172846 RepID=A0AAV4TY32_CAEEX|nr:hypothetical protein CEXT_712861 [Caerostris extrusa]